MFPNLHFLARPGAHRPERRQALLPGAACRALRLGTASVVPRLGTVGVVPRLGIASLLLLLGSTLAGCAGGAQRTSLNMEDEMQALAANPASVAIRSRLASELAADGHPDAARELLLVGLQAVEKSGDRVRLQQVLATLLVRDGNFLAAAEALEMAAGGTHPVGMAQPEGLKQPSDADRRLLLEQASRYREQDGAMELALRDLEAALTGLKLKDSETRLLQRLRAFQGEELNDPDDAIALLQLHADPEIRLRAIQFLTTVEFSHPVDAFAQALEDPDPRIVQLALREIGRRGESYDAVLLHPWLQNESPVLRQTALTAIAALASTDSIPVLIEALDPTQRSTFRQLTKALERLTGLVQDPDLDPDLEARTAQAKAWREWWQQRD